MVSVEHSSLLIRNICHSLRLCITHLSAPEPSAAVARSVNAALQRIVYFSDGVSEKLNSGKLGIVF
jgi:hypothetical protein